MRAIRITRISAARQRDRTDGLPVPPERTSITSPVAPIPSLHFAPRILPKTSRPAISPLRRVRASRTRLSGSFSRRTAAPFSRFSSFCTISFSPVIRIWRCWRKDRIRMEKHRQAMSSEKSRHRNHSISRPSASIGLGNVSRGESRENRLIVRRQVVRTRRNQFDRRLINVRTARRSG